ncbi:MAG: hypothetical protein M1822_000184 [Bathelium mastoideum]|nr:MAG: hypothetical protein M1822_000184 [Bathelium mastoideum]
MGFAMGELVLDNLSYSWPLFAVISLALLLVLHKVSTSTDVPYILGLPEIPGGLPIVGHLKSLGDDHATVCERWWRKYDFPTFQIRLGRTRAIVVNSFDDASRMLIKHQSATVDRPMLYTFHNLISSTQGFTIGTSPWSDSCKKKRTTVGKLLSRPSIKAYLPMFDLESYCVIRDLFHDSKRGTVEIYPRPYFQRYSLNTGLTLCYGVRMDTIADDLLKEIQDVGTEIELLRSASENFQDYVPLLRWLPNNAKKKRAKELRGRRDGYLEQLMSRTRDMVEKGIDNSCVASAIYKEKEDKLTEVELNSVCLSLISGGFSTLAGTLTSCIGSLSTSEGQKWQDRAFEDIKRHYPSIENAWAECFKEDRVSCINAIIHEATRYYTISAMNLPRKTVTDINWNGARIPAKTMVLVNLQAANHGKSSDLPFFPSLPSLTSSPPIFADVDYFGPTAPHFDPSRYLSSLTPPSPLPPRPPSSPSTTTSALPNPLHFSFGAGSRACSGQIIAHRLMHAALVRLLSVFRIEASESQPPTTDYVEYNSAKSSLVAIPRPFRVRLVVRDETVLERCLGEARKRTRELYAEG